MGHQWSPAEDDWLKQSRSYEHYCVLAGNEAREKGQAQNRRRRIQDSLTADEKLPRWSSGEIPDEAMESTVQSTVLDALPDIPEPEPPDSDDDKLWDEYFELREASILKFLEITERDDKTVRWKSPDDLPVGVCLCSDQHYGGFIRIDLLKRDIDLIANTEGLYAIGGGDWMDNYKPVGKAATGLFSASDPNPGHQYRRMVRLLKPSAGKWLVVMAGNHDDGWDMRSAGIARVPDLAKELDAPYASEAGCTLHLEVGWQRYTAFAKHTFRGTSGINKGNAARNMWNDWPWAWENADFVCLSHLHENHMEAVTRHGRDVVYLRSGSYKSGIGTDGYAESKGYRPEWGVPMVILFPDKRRLLAFKGQDFIEGIETLRMWREEYATRLTASGS